MRESSFYFFRENLLHDLIELLEKFGGSTEGGLEKEQEGSPTRGALIICLMKAKDPHQESSSGRRKDGTHQRHY